MVALLDAATIPIVAAHRLADNVARQAGGRLASRARLAAEQDNKQRGPAGPGRFLPWRCSARPGTLSPDGNKVVMVDDASPDQPRPAGGTIPGLRDWNHIPECGSTT
jgi:hypothetical protein